MGAPVANDDGGEVSSRSITIFTPHSIIPHCSDNRLKKTSKKTKDSSKYFFLSFFTIDDFNKKKLSCEIIFLQIQFFPRKCFFQWKCCIKIFFPDCAFPSLPMSVIEESCSDPTPVQENSRQENKLSFPVTFNPYRIQTCSNKKSNFGWI